MICGTANAACGQPTISLPVDAHVTGYMVAGDKLVSTDQVQAVLGDMTDEEREEFRMLSEISEGRKLRNRMGASPLAHTSLVYVRCVDGLERKMTPAAADAYVEQFGEHDGVEITRRGERPQPPDSETIEAMAADGTNRLGATKATIGPMFGNDGRQLADVQPLTTRSFMAHDMTRPEVSTPAIGSVGAHEDNPASTGSTETSSTETHVPRASVARVRKPDDKPDDKD